MAKYKITFNGETKMQTDYESCLPSLVEMKNMVKNGYKIYKDGKIYKFTNNKKNV